MQMKIIRFNWKAQSLLIVPHMKGKDFILQPVKKHHLHMLDNTGYQADI